MSKEELKIWFRNKFNSCYSVIDENKPESIYMFYDPQFIRQKKLSRILGENIEYPEKPSGIILFEQDYTYKYLYMDYYEITTFIINNYSIMWIEVMDLIKVWLNDTKLKVFKPQLVMRDSVKLLKYDKLKVLTKQMKI